MLPIADRLMITEVDLEIEAADAFFPEFDADQWDVLAQQELRSQDPACVMVEYLRRRT